ncbi:MAG TPA: hypothetical protein VNM92_05525 [Thermoanaerobaculia bacterium]|nr:hypothetical protein [Thermoanaerobaculia bacterium]
MPELFSHLGEPFDTILEAARDLASRNLSPVYVIGGPVRDRMLGRSFSDLDLTVADDAQPFAAALAARLSGQLTSYPRFLTHKLELSDGIAIDITTTRSERYTHPGALPEVEADDLSHDLGRRDFTINAIAVELTAGKIHDPWGGERDLDAGIIRILHDASFFDDPTRILRALRLAARFNFALDRHTEALLIAAISSNALTSLSRERVWREVFLAFRESGVAALLDVFTRFGALKSFLSSAASPSRPELDRLETASRSWPDADSEILFLSFLIDNPEQENLTGSGLSDRRRRNLASIRPTAMQLAAQLNQASPGRESLSILDRAAVETVAMVEALFPALVSALQPLRSLQNVKLDFDVESLGLQPGPHLGRALRETRYALALGQIAQSASASFARNLGLQYLEERSSGAQQDNPNRVS